MQDGEQSVDHPRRSWLPHPAWLTMGAIASAMLVGAAWFFWPFLRSSRLVTEIQSRGGIVHTASATPRWMQAYLPSDFTPALPLIRAADLKNAAADDDLLARLSLERQLFSVSLLGQGVTDTGVDQLARNPSLEFMVLIDCPHVTAATVQRLKQDRPNLKVSIRGPAFLGVEGHDDPRGCLLQYVRSGTPAALARLMPGDVITRFDDRPVTNYDSLIKAISVRKPGDEVVITYLRNGEEQHTRTTVAAWN